MEYTNGSKHLNGLGVYRLPNVPMSPNNLVETTRSPDTGEKDTRPLKFQLNQLGSLRRQTLDGYARTSSGPNSRLSTEYVSLQDKSGTKDKANAKVAWLEKNPKPKRLPSIRLVKCMDRERKSSIVEMLKAQGFEKGVKMQENLFAKQYPTQLKENGTKK